MFHTLPAELINQIAADIDREDLANLRRASIHTAYKFASSYFNAWLPVVHTDLSPKSMRRLASIGYHEDARHAVRAPVFGNPKCLESALRPLRHSETSGCGYFDVGAGYTWRRDRSTDTLKLAQSPKPISALYEIIESLTRCTAIGIAKEIAPVNRKLRVGLTGTDLVAIALSLVARGGPQIRELCMAIGPDGCMDRADLPEPSPTAPPAWPSFDPSWPLLEELTVAWLDDRPACHDSRLRPTHPRVLILPLATNLHVLNLMFDYCPGEAVEGILAHLTESPTLPPLESIRLHQLHLYDTRPVMEFLALFRETLQSLDIGYAWLYSGHWGAFFRELAGSDFHRLGSASFHRLHRRTKHGPGPLVNNAAYFCPLRTPSAAPADGPSTPPFQLYTQGILSENADHVVTGVRFESTAPEEAGRAFRSMADALYYTDFFMNDLAKGQGLGDPERTERRDFRPWLTLRTDKVLVQSTEFRAEDFW